MPLSDHLTLSREEKFSIAGGLLLVLLQALTQTHSALEYRAATAWSEPWRLLTAHLVHLNWPHMAINGAAWFVVARLFAIELTIARQAVTLVVSAIAIGAALPLVWPAIETYRGFSGVQHALYFAGAACWWSTAIATRTERNWSKLWLPTALLVGGWIKVLAEQTWDSSMPYADWLGAGTATQVHLIGALVATALGAAFARQELKRRARK